VVFRPRRVKKKEKDALVCDKKKGGTKGYGLSKRKPSSRGAERRTVGWRQGKRGVVTVGAKTTEPRTSRGGTYRKEDSQRSSILFLPKKI